MEEFIKLKNRIFRISTIEAISYNTDEGDFEIAITRDAAQSAYLLYESAEEFNKAVEHLESILLPYEPKTAIIPVDNRIKDKLLVSINLPIRVLNTLATVDIRTIGDLLHFSKNELLKVRNMGRKNISAIEDMLELLGLELPQEPVCSMVEWRNSHGLCY